MKRMFDIVISLVLLLALSPLFVLLAVLVRRVLGSPVFYLQNRVGLNEQVFKLYKLRTMTDAR
ncbi:MAG: sugar transferase, partial [Verrucomicrobiota bacterium]